MKKIESILARLRHWQLFLLLFIPFVVPYFLSPQVGLEQASDVEAFRSSVTWMIAMSIPWGVAFYAWIWVLGRVCNASLAPSLRRNGRVFNFAMPFALCYLPIAMLVFPQMVFAEDGYWLAAIVIPIHIAAVFLLFYAVIFSARSVASLGSDRLAGSGRSFLFLLGIMYFPIGIWFIQPRLNAAYEESQP